MIVDIHAHVFPYLGETQSFDSVSTHLLHYQHAMACGPPGAIRRASDSRIVQKPTLWDPSEPGLSGACDVDFKVGRFGKLEWTKDGTEYHVHHFAPSMQEMKAPPEFILAEMDYAGVDKAVLQNTWLYGQSTEYIAHAVKRYPSRFMGQARVKETEAHKQTQIDELRRAVIDLDLIAGLYYSDSGYGFWENDYRDHIDDEKFLPFWEEVRDLDIPVFWDLGAVPDRDHPGASVLDRYCLQMQRLGNWLRRFPDVPVVLVHGVQLRVLVSNSHFAVPDEVWEVWQKPNVHLEVLFPIQVSYPRSQAASMDYPYPELQPIIQALYERLGPDKLLWGSDMPNVERNCTYRQSLDYLVRYCDFIVPRHMDRIIGANAMRLLRRPE